MGKQRCGSCRFYKDAGMAGSGWCHHPLRKTTTELLIMVRRNELACRDEWSHSLWEEGSWSPSGAGADPVAGGRPLDPATETDIAAVLRAEFAPRPDSPKGAGEDVVLGEARLANDRTPPWRPSEPTLEIPRDSDPRTAIRRAREAYRERKKAEAAEQARAPQRAAFAAVAATELHSDTAQDATEPADLLTDEVGVFGLEEGAERRTNVAAEAGIADLGLLAEPQELGIDDEVDQSGAADPDGDDAVDDAWWRGFFDPDGTTDPTEATVLEPALDTDPAPRRGDGISAGWDELPAVEIAPVAVAPARVASSPWSVASRSGSGEADANDGFGVEWDEESLTPQVAVIVSDDEPWESDADEMGVASAAVHAAPDDLQSSVVDPAATADVDVETPPDHYTEGAAPTPFVPAIVLLPVGAVAPGVPRICRTCRDFRPAEGGERGWCANAWAFTARRMVQPDDPAACESSIGCWWLPTDELCLADADVSTHGQPTPTLDRWLPDHRQAVPARRRS